MLKQAPIQDDLSRIADFGRISIMDCINSLTTWVARRRLRPPRCIVGVPRVPYAAREAGGFRAPMRRQLRAGMIFGQRRPIWRTQSHARTDRHAARNKPERLAKIPEL